MRKSKNDSHVCLQSHYPVFPHFPAKISCSYVYINMYCLFEQFILTVRYQARYRLEQYSGHFRKPSFTLQDRNCCAVRLYDSNSPALMRIFYVSTQKYSKVLSIKINVKRFWQFNFSLISATNFYIKLDSVHESK